jgi:hypothetical protein
MEVSVGSAAAFRTGVPVHQHGPTRTTAELAVDRAPSALRGARACDAVRRPAQPRSRLSQMASPSVAPSSVARAQCTSQPATPSGPPERYPARAAA